MLNLIASLRRFFASILAALLMIGVTNPGTSYSVKDAEDCSVIFSVISDVHMEGNNKTARDIFIKEAYDIKNNASGNDALVLLGDNTMNGQHIENMFLYGILNKIKPADRVFMTLGNHDTGNGIDKYDSLLKRYYSYYNDFYGENVNSPYYYEIVNGYYFIFLGSEEDDVNSPVVSEEQFNWLDGILAEATENGKPVFVFGHHPYTHYENPLILKDIFTKYKNVFIFSGHMHNYFITAENLSETVHHFNLPRVTELDSDGNTVDSTGLGVNVGIYPDKVVIRERNFYTGEWSNEYEFIL